MAAAFRHNGRRGMDFVLTVTFAEDLAGEREACVWLLDALVDKRALGFSFNSRRAPPEMLTGATLRCFNKTIRPRRCWQMECYSRGVVADHVDFIMPAMRRTWRPPFATTGSARQTFCCP